jgi:multidrug efflux pump subunit AcrA (membrane-fusion protein)
MHFPVIPQPNASLVALAVWLAASAALAQAAPAASQVIIDDCEVSIIDEAKVPAQEPGQLTKMEAFEGLEVEEGTVLAQLDDAQAQADKRLAEAEHEGAEIEAKSDAEERVAKMTVVVAKAEWDQVVEANERTPGAKSRSEIRMKEYTYHKSVAQVDQVKVNRQLAAVKAKGTKAKVEAAEINVARRRIVAPISGTVVQLYLHRGEWANPADPVLHIVGLERLRVIGWVDAANYGPSDIAARPVQLNVQLPGGRPATFEGKITFVDPRLAPGGKRFLIHAEVINRKENGQWLLPPGLRGSLAIDLTHRLEERAASTGQETGPAITRAH